MSFLVPAKAFLQPSPTQRICFRVHLRVLEAENDHKKAVGGNGLINYSSLCIGGLIVCSPSAAGLQHCVAG